MTTSVAIAVFVVAAAISLATSWLLVSRIERIGGRLGVSDAMLGLLAALAADTPEISSAVSAVSHHQPSVGVGVVLGSNVFNLAALLGLGAMAAGGISLHRRVVLLEGAIGVWVAAVTVAIVLHVTTPAVGLVLVLVVLVPYAVVAGLKGRSRRARLGRTRLSGWLGRAMAEKEVDLRSAIRPRRGRLVDVAVGASALVVVITASVVMERAASTLGRHFSIADIVIGTVVLAVVTSLPNMIAGVYLARRGRGAASLSTALNSNAINVAAGLLVPAFIVGMGPSTANGALVALWYLGLTVLLVAFACLHGGLRVGPGSLIVCSYLVFVFTVTALGSGSVPAGLATYLLAPVVIVAIAAILLIWPPRSPLARSGQPSRGPSEVSRRRRVVAMPLMNWSVTRLWLLAIVASSAIAASDAILGRRVVLIGFLVIGPCCALFTGRWVRTAAAGAWVLILAVVVAIPDGIWATASQAVFLASITSVSLAATISAAAIGRRRLVGG